MTIAAESPITEEIQELEYQFDWLNIWDEDGKTKASSLTQLQKEILAQEDNSIPFATEVSRDGDVSIVFTQPLNIPDTVSPEFLAETFADFSLEDYPDLDLSTLDFVDIIQQQNIEDDLLLVYIVTEEDEIYIGVPIHREESGLTPIDGGDG